MYEDEKHMSLYGKSELTPTQKDGLFKNVLWRKDKIAKRHWHWPDMYPEVKVWSRHELDQMIREGKLSGWGPRIRPTVAKQRTGYEHFFNPDRGYDCKMHRDDRKSRYFCGCSIHDEESDRAVPLLTSSNYGHRLGTILEPFSRDHVRVGAVQKDFYKRRGTGLPGP